MPEKMAIIGGPVIDFTIVIEHFPVVPDDNQKYTARFVTPGGNATTLFMGARLGMEMSLLGHMGQDDFGEMWLKLAHHPNINLSTLVAVPGHPTSISVVVADAHGRHVFLGSADGIHASLAERPGWAAAIREADITALNGWNYRSFGERINLEIFEAARAAGKATFYDAGPEQHFWPKEATAKMLAMTTLLMLTEEEAEVITGRALPPEDMARALLDLGPELVLLKMGAAGNIVCNRGGLARHPGFPVEVVDTTGAGDSIVAAAGFAYLRGFDLEQFAIFCNAVGAAEVAKLGAGINAPTREEVEAILCHAGINLAI